VFVECTGPAYEGAPTDQQNGPSWQDFRGSVTMRE
jgi:hypothetical protein